MTDLECERLRRLLKPPCETWRDIRGLFHGFYCKSSYGGADYSARVARIEDGRLSGRSRVDGFLFEGLKGGSEESGEEEKTTRSPDVRVGSL